MPGPRRDKSARSYRPSVEALEALRLLDAASAALPELIAEVGPIEVAATLAPPPPGSAAAWDAALGQTRLADLLAPARGGDDDGPLASGFNQLDRYLSRAWYRAGIAPQQHDDCMQAVYVSLLQELGRDRFDSMVGEIGRSGIRDVLSRETAEGPGFFRAIDTVKKRAQRERTFQSLDGPVAMLAADADAGPGGDDLREAIERSLSPREAALIAATLEGETPAEIASRWGIAPKTVSNEKTRAIQKLREALTADLDG